VESKAVRRALGGYGRDALQGLGRRGGAVDGDRLCVAIDKPGDGDAICDPLGHFEFDGGAAVGGREDFDDEVGNPDDQLHTNIGALVGRFGAPWAIRS